MATKKLTKSVIEGLAPAEADYVVWDAELPGFGVRVKPSRVKSYVIQYRSRATGASRRKTIGQHGPLLSFHKARERRSYHLGGGSKVRVPVERDHGFRWKMITQSVGT